MKNSIAFPSKNLEVPNGFKRAFIFVWEEILRYWTHGLRVFSLYLLSPFTYGVDLVLVWGIEGMRTQVILCISYI